MVGASLKAVDEAGINCVVSISGVDDADDMEGICVSVCREGCNIAVVLRIMISAVLGPAMIDVFVGSGVFASPGTEAAKEVGENGIVSISVEDGEDAAFNVASGVALGIERLGGVLEGTVAFDRASYRDDSDGVRVTENSTRENFLDTNPE